MRIARRSYINSLKKALYVFLMASVVFSSFAPSITMANENPAIPAESLDLISNVLEQLGSDAGALQGGTPWKGISRVSVSSAGEATQWWGPSLRPTISRDGRFVAFESMATLTDEGNSSGGFQIYIHDRLTGKTELASKTIDQKNANESAENGFISGNGNFVVFESFSTNLVQDDTNGETDIFVRDMSNQVTERVSVSDSGVEGDEWSGGASISDDGRYVAFHSYSTNLIDGESIDSNNGSYYLHDRKNKTTIRLVNGQGEPIRGLSIKISGNGEFLVFESRTNEIVPGDSNNGQGIYVYHIPTGQFEKVSNPINGESAWGMSSSPFISNDGTYVTFTSSATNLVEETPEDYRERVYLYNRLSKEMELVSVGLNGDPDGHSYEPVVDDTGRYVVYTSNATNLATNHFDSPGDSEDVFVFDTLTKQTSLVNTPIQGQSLNGRSYTKAISGDGSVVAFDSEAKTLIPNDQSRAPNVFVAYDLNNVPSWPSDSSITLSNETSSSVTISWPSLDNQNILGYRIYQDGKRMGYVDAQETTYTLNGIASSEQHTIKVEAVNQSFNMSSNGPILLTNVDDKEPPQWPDNVKLTVESIGSTNVTFSWTSANDNVRVQNYQVFEKLDEPKLLSETPSNFINLSDLNPDTEYTFFVRAGDAKGNWSTDSPPLTVKTLPEGTGTVESALFVDLQPGGLAQLRWVPDDKAAVANYEIYRAKGSETQNLIKTVDPSVTTYEDSGLLSETSYTYQVIGKDKDGNEAYQTKPVTIETSSINISSLKWSLDNVRGYGLEEGQFKITLAGDANFTGEALLNFITVEENSTEQRIPLTESKLTPGIYEASYTLPIGITELSSLKATLSDSDGKSVTRDADNWQSVQMTGSLAVKLSFNGEIGDYLNGARLVAWSESKRSGNSVTLGAEHSYTIKQLIPSDDYSVRLITARGKVMKEVHPFTVSSGKLQQTELTVDLPASLQLKIVNPDDVVVPNIGVILRDENDQFIEKLSSDDKGMTNKVDGLVSNQKVIAEFILSNNPYQAKTETFTLDSFDNLKKVTLTPLARGTIKGEVFDSQGNPLEGISIYGTQNLNNNYFDFSTETDKDGKYELNVYEGSLNLHISSRQRKIRGSYWQEVEIKENEVTNYTAKLDIMDDALLDLEVYTQYIGEAKKGPLTVSEMLSAGINLTVSNPNAHTWENITATKAFRIQSFIGDTIEVCADSYFFERTCEKVKVDENWSAKTTIHLVEKGARIEGKVIDPKGTTVNNWRGILYEWNTEENRWEFRNSVSPSNSRISANVRNAGSYKLEIEYTDSAWVNHFVEKEFEILTGEIKDLQSIVLNPQGVFSGQKGNSLVAAPSETMPGRAVTFRGTYQHKQAQPINEVTLLLDIPKGTSFKEKSIMVNGKVPNEDRITYRPAQNRYEVTLQNVRPNEQGTISYQVQLDEKLDQDSIGAALKVSFSDKGVQKEENIGTAFVKTPNITFEVMRNVSTLKVPVSGRAPADSNVVVYAGNKIIGQTRAINTGLWAMNVNLPDLGKARVHELRAEAVVNENLTYRSDLLEVFYNPARPELESVTMFQYAYNKKVIVPSEGIARFPMSVSSGPFHFEVRFKEPHKVTNVEVHMGEESMPTILEDGVFKAVTARSGLHKGQIVVTYDNATQPFTFEIEPIETKEQLGNSLESFEKSIPYEFKDYKIENVTHSEKDGNFNASMDIGTSIFQENVHLDMSLKSGVNYTLTEEDMTLKETYGLDVYDFSYDFVEVGDEYHVKIRAKVPQTEQLASLNKGKGTFRTATVGQALVVAELGIDMILKIEDAKGAVKSYGQLGGYIAKLELLAEKLAECPGGGAAGFIERALNQAMIYESSKWALALGGVGVGFLASAATPAVGIAVGIASFQYSQEIGNRMDASMDRTVKMAEEMVAKQLEKCKDPDDENDEYDPINDPGSGSPVASPVYIYDPSGYVYEAVESNRLQGVKATVLNKNPETKAWEVWNAEWFEQINPQSTDHEGRYGWDVPEGLWKVIYEKEGYVSTQSAELEVLPPHFDVNIGMTSYASPEVTAIRAIAAEDGKDYVEVTFSKHIDSDRVGDNAVVIDSGKQTFTGVANGMFKDQEEKDKELTRVIRFVIDEDLAAGDSYKITVKPETIKSYAGVSMAGAYEKTVTVEAQDSTPPDLVSASVDVTGRVIHLTFDQPLDDARAFDERNFTLAGTNVKPFYVGLDGFDSSNKKMIIQLAGRILSTETVAIQIAADSLTDVNGNGNHAISMAVGNHALSTNAELSNLSFNTGKLTPAFNRQVREYTLTIDKGIQEISMTANPAHAGGKLQMEGMPLKSGVAKTIRISADETEVTIHTTAEDGRTKSSYSVKVVRAEKQDPNPEPEPQPQPQPGHGSMNPPTDTGKPVVDGNAVDITSWFNKQRISDENGKPGLSVIFNKEAVKQIAGLTRVKQAVIDLTGETAVSSVSVQMSAQVLRQFAEKGIQLVVKLDKGNILLFQNVKSLESFLKGANMKADSEAMLGITVAELEGKDAADQTAVAEKAKFRPVSAMMKFSLFTNDGGKILPLEVNKGSGIQIELNNFAADKVRNSKKLGAYHYADSVWEFVRGGTGANTQSVVFPLGKLGVYTIMEYDVTFTDIQKHWAQEEIEWLASQHVVNGYADGRFGPNATVTRAEFAKMILNAVQVSGHKGGKSSFTDVAPDNWYFEFVEAAALAGIVDGTGEGRFNPNGNITRQQMAAMITRAYELLAGKSTLTASEIEGVLFPYIDKHQTQPWAKESLAKAIQLGIISGMNKSTLAPNAQATRAEAAVMISRLKSMKIY